MINYIQPYYARKYPDDIVKRQRGLDQLAEMFASYDDMQHLVDDFTCEQSVDADQQIDCINVFTIHAAKCREWRAVFVVGLTQGLFPDARVASTQIDEERRLFYVACTRAKEQLFLSWPRRIMTADRKFIHAPMSPFLQVSTALYQTVAPPPF